MDTTPTMLSPETPTVLPTTNHAHPKCCDDIFVRDPRHLSQLLDEAVQRIIPTALERRQGILVTQIFSNKYRIEVDEGVPCGSIEEKRMHPHTK